MTRFSLLIVFVLLPKPARADDDIPAAIARGVTYLRSLQDQGGTWPHNKLGATALAALTLVECGAEPTDPAVIRATAVLRSGAGSMNDTYSIALTILLLDRLGDPGDTPLIQALGVRLLAGQMVDGGWSYFCPILGGDEETRWLTRVAQQRNELVAQRGPPRPLPPAPPVAKKPELVPEVKTIMRLIVRPAGQAAPPRPGICDNSNTQFATLGLWTAGRQGVPADLALTRVEQRFRASQNRDFGWGYHSIGREADSTATMTCAGLLGLAVSYGIGEARLQTAPDKEPKAARTKPARNPAQDPAIRNGLLALSTTIGQPRGRRVPRQPGRADRGYYFLWSLERVAMTFGLETIGKKDWYGWGSELLLAHQEDNGAWLGEFAQGGTDTCFALLFLKRANLLRDLTARLKGVTDPGGAVLKAGGVGGEALVHGPGLKPGVVFTPPASNGAEPAGDADRLARELVSSSPADRLARLKSYRDARGGDYTQALALAIPQLTGDDRNRARDALTERLSAMTADTLRTKLHDRDKEVRAAAALACAMREERANVGELITLLANDPDLFVARAAHLALRSLSGRDVPLPPDAGPADRAKAVEQWRRWQKDS
jgi:hypothetical protein